MARDYYSGKAIVKAGRIKAKPDNKAKAKNRTEGAKKVEYDLGACINFAATLVKVRSEAYVAVYRSYLIDCKMGRFASDPITVDDLRQYEDALREVFVDDDVIVYLQEQAENGVPLPPMNYQEKKLSRTEQTAVQTIKAFKEQVLRQYRDGVNVVALYGLRPSIVKRWVRQAARKP